MPIWATLALLTLPAAAAAGSIDSAPRIDNPAEAPSARTVILDRLWEVGGFSEAPGEFFGVILDLAADSQNRVYLLDMQLAEVKAFDAEGRYLRTLGGEGEGPGEFQRPGGVFVLPDDRLCVYQTSPARHSLFSPAGEYLGELPLPSPLDALQRVYRLRCQGGVIGAEGLTGVVSESATEHRGGVYRFQPGDSVAMEIAPVVRRFEFASKVVSEEQNLNPLRWCLGQDGRLFLVEGSDYAIRVWSPEGSPERQITRDFQPYHRSEAEKEAVRDLFRRGGGTEGTTIEVMDCARDVAWMAGAPGGRLWVISSRGKRELPEGCIARVDVYGPEGRLLEVLTLMGEGAFDEDRIVLSGDRLYVLRHYADAFRSWQATLAWNRGSDPDEVSSDEEAEPMRVICYKLPAASLR